MSARLLVLLGAGASWDCATGGFPQVRAEYRPPLVTELFEKRRSFTDILHNYPLAEQAAADIRAALSRGSVALEALLRDKLRDSEHEYRRRQFWAIPLYLEHLMLVISSWDLTQGYTVHPDNYDRLINAVLQVPEVTFVTLNYDTLLDRRLELHGRLDSMGAYLAAGKNWALIKPHGSVDWSRRVDNALNDLVAGDPVLAETFAAMGEPLSLGAEILLRRHRDVAEKRGLDRSGGMTITKRGLELYYPALSAPLGAQDELVCPPEHIEYLKRIIGAPDPLDMLVIGYSGLDEGVLELLSWGTGGFRSLTVVSNNAQTAELTTDRITSRVRVQRTLVDPIELHGDGFAAFVDRGHLDGYVDRVLSLSAKPRRTR